jgi:Cu/Ag efflux protein CusF
MILLPMAGKYNFTLCYTSSVDVDFNSVIMNHQINKVKEYIMAISKSVILHNKINSHYMPISFLMAVVSDVSEESIMTRIKSGNSYEVVVLVSSDGRFFKDINGRLSKFAVGVNSNGSIITS